MKLKTTVKTSYFDTLNDSLIAESLIELWPISTSISYGETKRVIVEDGSEYGQLISVYRNSNGRYERPIYYSL